MTDYVATSGNPVSEATINSDDTLTVQSGGLATDDLVTNGGVVTVLAGGSGTALQFTGGTLSDAGTLSGLVTMSADVTIDGSSVSGILGSGTTEYVSSGGVTTGDAAFGDPAYIGTDIYVEAGGTVSAARISGGAELFAVGGTVSGTVILSGGVADAAGDGAMIVSTTVSSGGSLETYFGGIASTTVLSAGATQYVQQDSSAVSATVLLSGREETLGVTSNATVSSGGLEVVDSGGDAIVTVLNSGAAEFVQSGGTANGTLLNSGSVLVELAGSTVSNAQNLGGTVISTGVVQLQAFALQVLGAASVDDSVESGSTEYVLNGGVATSTSVSSSGTQAVQAGGSAVSSVIGSGGMQTLSSGGMATATAVLSGGNETVQLGATANGLILSSGGTVQAAGTLIGVQNLGGIDAVSGTAVGGTVGSGGEEFVYGMATGTVLAGGTQEVFDGSAVGTMVAQGGLLSLTEAGTATGTVVLAGGELNAGFDSATATVVSSGGFVLSDGVLSGTTISSGGAAVISSAGSAVATTLLAGGILVALPGAIVSGTVSSGGLVISTGVVIANPGSTVSAYAGLAGSAMVNAGGFEYVLQGGVSSDTVVSGPGRYSTSGEVDVFAGGFAVSTTVDVGGSLQVLNGGSAIGGSVTGALVVSSGGVVSGVGIGSGGSTNLYGSSTSLQVGSGGSAEVEAGSLVTSTTVLSSGLFEVDEGATVSLTTLAGSAFSEGTLVGTTVLSGGTETDAGGTAIGTTINSGGIEAANGTTTSATVLTGGTQAVGGVASATTVASGGLQTINYGGSATGTLLAGEEFLSSGGSVIGTTAVSGAVIDDQNGSVTSAILNGGSLIVGGNIVESDGYVEGFTSGTTTGTVVGSGGVEIVSSGSTAVDTVVQAGGLLVLTPGATETGTVLAGGQVVSTGVVLLQSGSAPLYYATSADGLTLGSGTQELILTGGTASGTILNAGAEQDVLASGTVTATTVSNGGNLEVDAGGLAVGATILLGGSGLVTSGGTASGADVISGGFIDIQGSSVSGSVSAGGLFEVDSGGIAVATSVGSGGAEGVFESGTTSGTVIQSGGASLVLDGTTSGTVVQSGGGEALFTSGSSFGTIVQAGGAQAITDSSTLASGTVVQSGGILAVLPGAVPVGVVSSGGQVVSTGIVTYQIFSGTTTETGPLVDPVLVSGGQTFVLSGGVVSGGVVSGAYPFIASNGFLTDFPTELYVASGGTANGTRVLGGAAILVEDGTVSGLIADSGGIVELDSGTAAATTVLSSGAEGVDGSGVEIAAVISGGKVEVSGTGLLEGASFASIGGGVLEIDQSANITGVLSSIAVGDSIEFTSMLSSEASVSVSGDIVTVGGQYTVDIAGAVYDSFTLGMTTDSFGNSVSALTVAAVGVPCYCPGTRILTDRGEVPVETLVIGDRLVTASGAIRDVRWIGRRSYTGIFAANNPDVLPVVFRAGALGGGLPRRDLWVSPLHAMFVDGALIPACLLVNGVSIMQAVSVDQVEYVHVELESHDLLMAEGVPAESFVDDQSRGMFHNATEYRLLYPEAVQTPARYCAPRLEEGEVLDAVQRRLAALVGPVGGQGTLRGFLDTTDCDTVTGWARNLDALDERVLLRVVVNGAVLGEVVADQERHDLRTAGEGDGRHAFSFTFPGGLSPQMRHTVEVMRVADRQALRNSPVVVEPIPLALPTALVPPTPLAGVLDRCDRDRIVGWAWQPGADAPVALQVLDNGVPLVRILANLYRSDLRPAGMGNGRHGFDITIPGGLSPLARHVLEFRRESDGAVLPGTPVVIEPAHSFDLALEDAVARAVASLNADDEQDRVLSFLVAQTERLLQSRAAISSGAEQRRALAQFRRRWGPNADGFADAPKDAGRRALVIDNRLPVRGRDAGSEAVLSHMQAMQSLGYNVSIVAADELAGSNAILSAMGISCLGLPAYASVEDVLRRHAGCFELVYLHRASMAARYLQLARQYLPRARVIYSVADLHHVRMARQARIEDQPELLAASQRMRLMECTAAWSANAVITHSAEEAAVLRSAVPGASVHVVPWTVPVVVARGGQRRRRFADRAGIAFIGHGAHAPNADAARWLVEVIMPLVWQTEPGIECVLVGSALPESVRRLARPGVTVLGHVPDLRTVFDRVRLTVAPLRFGAGIKGKVLTSLAARTPCIMTPTAAEGLHLPLRLRDLIAEDATGIASLIVRLHGDEALVRDAARSGADMMRRAYSEAAVTAALESALDGQARLVERKVG